MIPGEKKKLLLKSYRKQCKDKQRDFWERGSMRFHRTQSFGKNGNIWGKILKKKKC